MAYTLYPLLLGDVEADSSFVAWGNTPGQRIWLPTTAWLIIGATKPILVDAGFRDPAEFTAASGVPARRTPVQTLEAQLARHNLVPSDIGHLIFTHLHHDHSGLAAALPQARILVQRAELQYAAAPLFPVPFFDRVDISTLIGPLWERIELLDGEAELFPGIRTVLTGGHTPAHQMLYVDLPGGTAIITGDAAYIAAVNVTQQVPMGYFVDLPDVMAALRRIARDGTYVLPMHDSAVIERYAEGVR
jgi:glyoxylase-like metal-dependent hydrolase (beta-lactamase superfamily II)